MYALRNTDDSELEVAVDVVQREGRMDAAPVVDP